MKQKGFIRPVQLKQIKNLKKILLFKNKNFCDQNTKHSQNTHKYSNGNKI